MANRERMPTLSNEAQLKIMNMVKQGMSMDEALKRAAQMEAAEVMMMMMMMCGCVRACVSCVS